MKKCIMMLAVLALSAVAATAAPRLNNMFSQHELPLLQQQRTFKHAPRKAGEAVVTLPITTLAGVQFFSHSDFSAPGKYYYYLGFQGNGEYNYPWVGVIAYMPTDEGLTEGTYTLGAEQLEDIMLVQNDDDYYAALYGYDSYVFQEATLVLTKVDDSKWKFSFMGSVEDGTVYQFELTAPVNVETISDGNTEEGGGDDIVTDYHYESTTATQFTVPFDNITVYDGFVKDYGILDVTLYSKPFNEKGDIYKCELYLFTYSTTMPTGTFPIEFSGYLDTYMGSYGVTATGADYPCYLQVRDQADYIIGDWYFVEGSITSGYDEANQLYIAGSVKTYNGSEIELRYGPVPVGIHSVLAPAGEQHVGKMLKRGEVIVSDGQRAYDLSGVQK